MKPLFCSGAGVLDLRHTADDWTGNWPQPGCKIDFVDRCHGSPTGDDGVVAFLYQVKVFAFLFKASELTGMATSSK